MKRDLPEVPKTLDDLVPAIQKIIDGVSDPAVAYGPNTDGYGKCVEAMWRCAYIVHEYVASQLGVTGFQHDVSSLSLLGALRRIDGPYKMVNGENALYPQYDLVGDTKSFLESDDVRTWLAERARELIAEAEGREPIVLEDGTTMEPVAGRVREHWNELAAYQPVAADKH